MPKNIVKNICHVKKMWEIIWFLLFLLVIVFLLWLGYNRYKHKIEDVLDADSKADNEYLANPYKYPKNEYLASPNSIANPYKYPDNQYRANQNHKKSEFEVGIKNFISKSISFLFKM